MELPKAAREDDDLVVAHMLIRLSRSETSLPCRHLLAPAPSRLLPPPPPPPSAETEGTHSAPQPPRPPMPTETTWGGRRRRRRSRPIAVEGTLAAKGEEARRRDSPTTPLSWSGGGCGGSATSGSVCGGGSSTPPRPPERRKRPSAGERRGPSQPRHVAPRQKAELCYGGQPAPTPPPAGAWERRGASRTAVAGAGHEAAEPHGEPLVGAPTNQSVEVVPASLPACGPEISRSAVGVESLRWRLMGQGSVVFGHPGKKRKTVAELHVLEESMLQEQEELQKELEKQMEAYNALVEENVKLKKLESNLASDVVIKPTATSVACEEAKPQQSQHVQSTVESQTVDDLITVSILPEEEWHEQLSYMSSPIPLPRHTFLLDLNCLPDEY